MSQEHLVALTVEFASKTGKALKVGCSDRHDDLLEVFGINVQNDSEATHPKAYSVTIGLHHG